MRGYRTLRRQVGLWCCAVMLGSMASISWAEGVTITPLGSENGELCPMDRALVLEDPTGTRLLYDPGRTVAGANDPRLGDIDVVLISHMHADHVGDKHIKAPNSGCAALGETESDLPATNAVKIAVEHGAKIVTGSEMPAFFAAKLRANGGDPDQSVLARFGGSAEVGGVKIATVPALHSNGVAPALIEGALGEQMAAAGLSGHVGPATGYMLTFSNGLVVYLSGDTGLMAAQKSLVHDYYGAKLAVVNIGDTYTMGPQEAAYAVNEWIQPTSVIASHVNEVATQQGQLVPSSKTEQFIEATNVPVYLPRSGFSMRFDETGRCLEGCDLPTP